MDKKAMYKLSCGLFVLTAKSNGRANGCITNTAIQAASEPNQMSVCVNKENFTHDMIKESGKFCVSVISVDADFNLFKHFGFQSGRDVDKFDGFDGFRTGENGVPFITEGTNAYFEVNVEKTEDLGSHTMFIGTISEMEVLNDAASATYEYYQEHIKPKRETKEAAPEGKTIWKCRICGYEYTEGDLPEDWVCPICGVGKDMFEEA